MTRAKKPSQRIKRKHEPKRLATGLNIEQLTEISEKVAYISSEYHSKGEGGFVKRRKHPAASRCEDFWTKEKALDALRGAVLAGHISDLFINGFPAKIWYKRDKMVYEAQLSNRATGEYHGFPLDDPDEWPVDFNK